MCHGPTGAAAVPQVPAGVTQLDLTSTASNEEPLQPVSYRRLLFAHDEQAIMMGVLTDVLVAGPIDPTTGLPTQVPVTIGPPMNAGSALGSTQFFNEFAASGTHAGYLSPAELRLISDWLVHRGSVFQQSIRSDRAPRLTVTGVAGICAPWPRC